MLSELLKKWSEEGMYLPFAHDGATGKSSVTLFFLYITAVLSIASLIIVTYKDPIIGTIITCIYSVVWAVLYLMRRLQKAKFDLDDRSFELEGEDDAEVSDKT